RQASGHKGSACRKGFRPGFGAVEGGAVRQRGAAELDVGGVPPLPEPALPPLTEPCGILVTGVGGTGVVTIGALVGMAAHLEGKGVTVLDMTGLAQKGGAVVSHVRIAEQPEQIHAVRLATGGADLLLGCDLVVSAGAEALSKLSAGHTSAIINSHETITGDFTRNPDLPFPARDLQNGIVTAVGSERAEFVEATRLATSLLGDA